MKGWLIFLAALIVSFALGIGATALVEFITRDEGLAQNIGTGVWFFSLFLMLPYGMLWLAPERFAIRPEATSMIQRQRDAKAENELRAAELRMGLVWGIIGATMAAVAHAAHYLIAIVGISCGIVGMVLGADYKRRVRRIREPFDSERASKQVD